MKKAYLGISLSQRPNFESEIALIKKCLLAQQIDLWVFVDQYHFAANEEKAMMKQAFSDLEACDLLVVEMTKKAVGVGIEVGYAVARNLPIIYLKKSTAKYSTTTGGCSDYFIDYQDIAELKIKLDKVMKMVAERI